MYERDTLFMWQTCGVSKLLAWVSLKYIAKSYI